MEAEHSAPIFVGGTGRSGTSIMGNFLNSHTDVVLPVRENKLIVEAHGLRTLVDQLDEGFDYKSNHFAIAGFLNHAALFRTFGFRDRRVHLAWRIANKIRTSLAEKTLPLSDVSRKLGGLPFCAHSLGEPFGHAHYDACLEAFKAKVIADIDEEGVADADGLVRPAYMASTFDRDTLLDYSRAFLSDLYGKAVAESGARTWCDDTPVNAIFSEFLLELYPDAKIIHMVRDPRDVLASYLEQPWVSSDIDRAVLRLSNTYRRLIDVEGRDGQVRFLSLRLEDFCSDFEAKKAELCDHCGISSDGFDGSVRFEQGRIGTWRRKIPADQHERITKDLAFALDHFGYDPSK